MRVLLNVIWLVLSGFWLALGYALAGVVMVVLIVTIPFGLASFRLAAYVLWPFGRTIVRRPEAGAASAVGNVVWCNVVWCIANFKLAAVALAPLGKEIVPTDDPRVLGPAW